MSVQTLYTAATGMSAMETKLDVIANNLANIETTAFKRGRANFEDLFYRHLNVPGAEDSSGQITATGLSLGMGTRVSSTQTEFRQGSLQQTGRQLDVAIEGEGFFQVIDPSGETLYTRSGNFSQNANGEFVMGSAGVGRLLEPSIVIPPDATAVSISTDGIVAVRQQGSQTMNQVGTIDLVTFINPEGLLKLGENLYAETGASGSPTPGTPGLDGRGFLRQSTLEASNVEPVRELIDLITTQRAFEMNSQTVQVGDQIMQLVANLRRG
ncbi:MAG: flagellar basal-body rod protein FlgG [Planctomycetota bacterium]|jgi:flagellar basal-body rod protein FlgG